jgi:hypothetical protein
MKTTIQKATYTGKKTGVLLEIEYARYFNDGCNNPKITVEGTAPCQNKRKITLTLMAPMQPLAGQKQKLVQDILNNLGGLGGGNYSWGFGDKFKKYGVYIDGNFYKVATLDDLLVVKQAMGI